LLKRSWILSLTAFVFGGVACANASRILLLGSYGTSALNRGVGNSGTIYDPADSTVKDGLTSTFEISPGTVWHATTGKSSYVSFSAASGSTLSTTAPKGDYIYKTNFLISSSDVNSLGTLTVLADDTISVLLNDHLIVQTAGAIAPGNPYSHCSNAGPNCVTPDTFAFSGLQAGLNQLEFDVKQGNGSDEGLDFSGSIGSSVTDPPSIPEPLPLALFGTGLLGLVGVSRRYAHAE
jgi:hypothetical protein